MPPPLRGSNTDTPSRPQMRRGCLRERPAALPPPTAPRARKCVGGVSDNEQSPRHLHHATPDIPRARKRVRVYPTMPQPPPPDGPSCSQMRRGCLRQHDPTPPPLPACKRMGASATAPAAMPHHRRHPSRPQTLGGYMRPAASPPADTPSRSQMRGCMRQRPPPPPPAPRARSRVGVSATTRHRAGPTTPRRHPLPPPNAGVYATTPAAPPPPRHRRHPSRLQTHGGFMCPTPVHPLTWSPFSLANAEGCVCDNLRSPRCPTCALAHTLMSTCITTCIPMSVV
jgi:hypothetical protein